MKTQETLKMYGETFIVHRGEVKEVYPQLWDYTDIYQAYKKPSDSKIAVWNYWFNFGLPEDKKEPYRIGIPFISSRNCFSFVVVANVYTHDHTFVGIMKITKDYNRLFLKED